MGSSNVIKAGTAATVDSGKAGSAYDTNKSSEVLARVFMVIYGESDKNRLVNMFPSIDKLKLDFGDIAAYSFINNQTVKGSPLIAKPLDPNITRYPIRDELVKLQLSSTYQANNPSGNHIPQYYYTSTLGAWGTTEHNAVPEYDKNFSDDNIFNETGKIRKLIQGPGDMSFEGRSGHSIRFGSSVKDFTGTPWVGPDRSPFMIIRNGQKDATGLDQIYEDINKDGSSFYMLNGHSIGFVPASLNFDSYGYNVVAQVNSNVVETKPVVQTLPSQSAAVVDAIPVKDTIPETLPISQQASASVDDLAQQDEAELPENEGLEFYQETEYIGIATERPSDLLPKEFSINVGYSYVGSKMTVNKEELSKVIKEKSKYKDLQIVEPFKTSITKKAFADIINSLISTKQITRTIGICTMATCINEQGSGNMITGFNYNHGGIQTDNSQWPKGRFNISFNGQFYFVDNGRVGRMFASFASSKDCILFVAAALERKHFQTVMDANSYASLYVRTWWSNGPKPQNIVNEKSKAYNDALKYIK